MICQILASCVRGDVATITEQRRDLALIIVTVGHRAALSTLVTLSHSSSPGEES